MDDLTWALMQKWGLHFCQRRRWSFCHREFVSDVLSEARTRHVILSCRTLCCWSDKLPSVWFQVEHFVMKTCDKSIWSLSAFKKWEYHEQALFFFVHNLIQKMKFSSFSRFPTHKCFVCHESKMRVSLLESNYRKKNDFFLTIFSLSEMQLHVAQVSCCSPCSAVGNVSGWIWRDCERPFNGFTLWFILKQFL